MPSPLIYLTEGTRIFFSSWKKRIRPLRYAGTAEEICRQIVKDCWNGRYFQTSTGNFSQFWTRDFGWCTQALVKLGYREQAQRTARYALHRFQQAGKITTTLTPRGKPFDFPVPAVDSLPWFLHSIRISKVSYHAHRSFLNREIRRFFHTFIDPQTGLVQPHLHVSSMKDQAIRKSSCYDNCLVGLLAQEAALLKLENPFQKYDYPNLILRHFWNGSFFYDDLSKKEYVAGDANLFPFLLGLVKDSNMLSLALKSIQQAGLDQPFPLKYTAGREGIHFIPQEIVTRDYESNAVWTHMGPLFIAVVHSLDPQKAEEYHEQYRQWIEQYGNYLEVFTAEGKPYRSPFYSCDSGMLWAANYLKG